MLEADSPSRALPRSRRLARKLIFSLVPLAVLLGAAELAVRLFGTTPPARTRGGYVVPDPDLIWRLDPDGRGPLQVNGLGLRDNPRDLAAEVQFLLLGDSVSWGDQLADRAVVWPQVLERVLDERDGSRRHEVINASVPGYSTFQQLGWLRRDGAGLEVDALVLQFCLNDVTERYHALAGYGGDDVFLGVDTRAGIGGVHGVLLRHSAAYGAFLRLLQSRSRQREEYDVRKLARDSLSPELSEAWRVVLSELSEVRQVSVERDLPFTVVVPPYRFQLQGEGRRQPQHRLLAWGREEGVEVIDLLPAFRRAPEPRGLFLDANHLSVRGHRLVAEALAGRIDTLLTGAARRP